jgi:membrane-associated phospholipid phosphatase
VFLSQGAFAKDVIEEIGDYFQVIIPAYAVGMTIKESDYTGTKQFLCNFGAMEANIAILKSVTNEDRPDHSDNNSFPSGHTAAAFAGATFIHKRYGIKQAIIPYLMAGFVGYSRIEARKHHFHDVAAGAAISGLWTWALVDEESDVRLSVGTDGAGLSFKTQF